MKRLAISRNLTLCVALLGATTAFGINKKSVTIPEHVSINGQTLAVGNYKVEWEGSGPNVELSFRKYNKVVATAPARVIDLQQPDNSDSLLLGPGADGNRSLQEIHFSGKKYALMLRSNGQTVGSGESANQ